MAFFTDVDERIATLRTLLARADDADLLPQIIERLDDAQALQVIRDSAAVIQAMQCAQVVAAGVVAARSTRERGHSGLAQTQGHRNPVSLVQELTGTTRATAVKHIRLGETLLEGSNRGEPPLDPRRPSPESIHRDDGDPGPAEARSAVAPWHAPLGAALLAGTVTADQHHAILRGLGEPPSLSPASAPTSAVDGIAPALSGETDDREAARAAAEAGALEAWSVAAEHLVREAEHRTVEELASEARAIRDRLDPEGAAARFASRFEQRSFRMYSDADGRWAAHIIFDDEAAAWIRAMQDAALRPRRGGPRFIDPEEKAQADRLTEDRRTNDQLAYDLFIDVLRAGSLASAEDVFGARQPGVRLVTVVDEATIERDDGTDADQVPATVAHFEDDGTTVPSAIADQHACTAGATVVTLDREGNPLFLGRPQRLFTAKQRTALAVRDGGCRWKGCDRPASYCEAHHIDHYKDGGHTDVDRGILLCRYHHMQLHHGKWRITREGAGDFVLHPPGRGTPIVLKPRLALSYAWGGIAPPLRRWRVPPSLQVPAAA
jgi:hypothetical protein